MPVQVDKPYCGRCGKRTIRVTDTICGTLCEKCIRELRHSLRCSLASIWREGKKRRNKNGSTN
ncbi:MAG: hypothetical protein NC222_06935 [Staphylococcus sp.]|nr:hypothetical protein [Staphylococcus sp.]